MNKILNRLVWIFFLAPGIYLAVAWNSIPETVALHFDWNGKADRYGSRKELLIMTAVLSGMCLVVYFLLSNIYRIDPKRYAAENKLRLQRLAFGAVVFISALLCLIIYNSAHGIIRFRSGLLLGGVGLLFAFIGNYLPNLKPNYFAGLRLPWTLESEENWRKTHALMGRLWFIGGLFLAIVCLFLPDKPAMIVFFAVMITITAIPIGFSYRLYAQQKKSKTP